jgi:hypothetical protein
MAVTSRGGRSVVTVRTKKNYGRKPKMKSQYRGFHILRNKYDTKCFACDESIRKNELIYWARNTKRVVHHSCMSTTVAKNALSS